jgi:hypothetical protein
MHRSMIARYQGLVMMITVLLTTPACTIKGTLKATTDPTTDILSSSFRTWFTEEGYVKDEYKVIAYASLNFTNLKQDMARGRGEYLHSLGTLIGVSASRREEFAALLQTHYGSLVPSAQTTPAEMLAALTQLMTVF